MNRPVDASNQPPRPLMIFDGECAFCRRWIERWRRITGDRVDYVAYQDPAVARIHPEIPQAELEAAVTLITPDGARFQGAEAVFRSLAFGSRATRLLKWYEQWPWFARVTDWLYRFVARHRRLFSKLTLSR